MTQLKNFESKSKAKNKSKQAASFLAVGTVAIDAVETPFGKKDKVFGGSASYFSYAASFFTQLGMVAVVGEDFPDEYRKILTERNIELSHLQTMRGKTFSWHGKYDNDMNSAQTLATHLNVLAEFNPVLNFKQHPEYLFLANIDPTLQLKVLDQCQRARLKYVACDTMNFWIASKRKELIKVINRVDCIILNDGEARQLTQEINLVKAARVIRNWGPSHVVIKKGEHGVMLFHENKLFILPAFPLETVFDPTGAGDSFAGAFIGYLVKKKSFSFESMKTALSWATIMASFTVESFGLDRLRQIKHSDLTRRMEIFKKVLTFTS